MNVSEQIASFEQMNKNCVIAYGGDGTLLDVARKNGFKKAVFPVRDYGLCEEHREALSVLFGKATKVPREIKQTLHPLLGFKLGSISDLAAAEVVVKNKDVTSCLRLDLLVNGKLYMENVICDGVIFATALGSHGYFKSVTRTIFSDDGF